MLTRDPILAQEPNDQPEQPISGSERVEATKAVVLLVEEDALLRRQLLQAVPPKVGAQAFPGLDELDGAKFRPGSPVVLVLGPSQATAETLERVGALLRATRGAGAVLVVQHPSAKLMSLALRSGVNDAIELSDVGAQLPVPSATLPTGWTRSWPLRRRGTSLDRRDVVAPLSPASFLPRGASASQ